jgi:hypothetical protein
VTTLLRHGAGRPGSIHGNRRQPCTRSMTRTSGSGLNGVTSPPGGHPGLAGGLWLWMTLVLSLFHAVVVPSGFRTTVQPHW